MKLSKDEAYRKASEIQSAFNCSHGILYVGCGITDEELKDHISNLPWSCVITSRTDSQFSGLFANERRIPREYTDDSVSATLLNRKNMPILRLFGIDGEKTDDYHAELMEELGFVESDERKVSQKFLNILPDMLDCVNLMFVVGYDSTRKEELELKLLAENILKVVDKSILFFGMGPDTDERLIRLANKKQFPIYENTFSEIMDTIAEKEEVEADSNIEFEEQENIFFKEHGAVSVSYSVLQRTNHFAILLTEQGIYRERPYGKSSLQLAFSNFLRLSATENPQWYGYFEKNQFFLDRPFRKTVYTLVKAMLKGKNSSDIENDRGPIVLEGAPGSSKSIILAAVAFQLYQEHEYPVIFIKNDNLTFYNESEELEALNLLMKDIEKAGDKDSKVLLVWDCSSHRNVIDNAKNLVRMLENYGRRFVLLCSAYAHGKKDDTEKCILENDEIYFYEDGCYYIESSREINDDEKRKLRQLFQDYSGISNTRLNQWWTKLEQEANNDIFIYFYKMITLLQEPLRERLTKEQRIVGNYVENQLNKILEGYEKDCIKNTNNIFSIAGIDMDSLKLENMEENEEEELVEEQSEYDLEKFNVCIALLSQFKIPTPYSLAAKMLIKNYREDIVYSSERRELFQLLTTQIPWIYYGRQTDNDDFKFFFRNVVEAEIFLEKNNVTPEKQVEIICNMIQIYGEGYQQNDFGDQELKNCIQLLLRMIGPNTDYNVLAKSEKEHRQILRQLESIIAELGKLRTYYHIADEDGSFVNLEVTFMREYYGWKWDEIYGYTEMIQTGQYRWECLPQYYNKNLYEKRLKYLEEAIYLAVKKLETVEIVLRGNSDARERKSIVDRRNSLTNEMVLCNLAAEEVQNQYKECCWHYEQKTEKRWEEARFVLPYRDIFKRMQAVIDSNPTNGYYYNTIMKVFQKEYSRKNISEQLKMEYLSEINLVIDPLDSGEIPNVSNRGSGDRDELSEHIAEIRQLAANYTVEIKDLDERNDKLNAFYRMYDQMQEVNNPTAILFVCRQELRTLEILKQKTVLSEEQRQICSKVAIFMEREDNMRCIETKPMAMAMLIRVVWMEYSGLPLSNLKEANVVSMSKQHWKKLERLCAHYMERANGVEKTSIMLIYALAVLHTTGDYMQCAEILSHIKEKDFYSNMRMRTPYIYCDENSKPFLYTGEVLNVDGDNGYIRVHKLPQQIKVKFNKRNLGFFTEPIKKGDVLNNLELGIGYTGFSMYREAGRRMKAGL